MGMLLHYHYLEELAKQGETPAEPTEVKQEESVVETEIKPVDELPKKRKRK